MDDLRYLRDRQASLIAQLDRRDHHAPDPTAVLIGKVFDNGHLPTTTGNYYAVHPVTVGGTESEGSAGTFSVDTASTVFFLVICSKAPIVGDVLIARSIDGRWVAEWGQSLAGLFHTIPGCGCTDIPTNLTLTCSNHFNSYISVDDTLTYGPTPAAYAPAGLGANSFLGDTTWTDPITGQSVRYALICDVGTARYALTRVFTATGTRDSINYTWTIGISGNTCGPPFHLVSGTVRSGGSSVVVNVQ
jgi:hypothetical protein